jgi:hypothetical protein
MTPEEMLVGLLMQSEPRPAAEVSASLQAIWPRLHAPQRSHRGTELVALFHRAGYVSDGVPRPSSALIVYRGELVGVHEPGISWTADFQIAKQYAQGYAAVADTRVIQATASPEAVLARFTQEVEVVVAPHLLKDVTELGRMQHFTLPRLTPF